MRIAYRRKLLGQGRQALTLLSNLTLEALGSGFVGFTVDQVFFLHVTRAAVCETHSGPGIVHIPHRESHSGNQDLDDIASSDLLLRAHDNLKTTRSINGAGW